jgi:hypothetical protein
MDKASPEYKGLGDGALPSSIATAYGLYGGRETFGVALESANVGLVGRVQQTRGQTIDVHRLNPHRRWLLHPERTRHGARDS